MKRLLLIGVLGLLALAPAAFGASSALTVKGAFYSIDAGDENAVALTRRSGEEKETIVVPGTADDVRDHHAQLEYDRVSDRLYVVWIRDGEEATAVMLSSLDAEGTWSEPIELATAAATATRDELRTVLTRAKSDGVHATLIHVATWARDGESLTGEYALVAFEGASHASTSVSDFQKLDSETLTSVSQDDELDVQPVFPPLAMSAATDGVDMVYGRERGTSVTRIHIGAKLVPNARLWKPVGRTGGVMPPAHFAAMSTSPVRAFFSRSRVVLYTNDSTFRFVVFEDGAWSPTRAFTLDETLTGEALLNRIRQSIEEDVPAGGSQPVSQ